MLKKFELKNGTTVIVNEIITSKSISCYGYFPYGVATENEEHLGITHLLEHLMFSGLENYSTPIEVAQSFEKIGAVTDAVTFRDMMTCGIQCEVETFAKGFKLLSEVLLNAKFTENQVENEKKVIKEELDYYSSEEEFAIWGSISETLWGHQHHLGRRIEGRWDKIDKLSYEVLVKHYQDYYTPDKLTLFITGAIDQDQLAKLLSEFEEHYLFTNHDLLLPSELSHNVSYREYNHFPSTSEMVWVGIGFPFHDGTLDRVKVELIEMLLTEGNASILQQSIREEKGLLYHLTSDSNTSRFGGEYALSFCTDIKKWEKTLEIIKSEIIRAVDFSEKNFNIAKRRYKAQIAFQTESTKSHTRFVGRNYMVHHNLMDVDDMIRKLSELTSDELRVEMRKIFINNSMSISIISKEVI
jgi:predicted Zn-dependent peptidase